MLSGVLSPRMSPVFGGKEFSTVFVRKAKNCTENLKYVNLNEQVLPRGRKTVGKEFQGFFFTSMDSSSGDDDCTTYKPSRRNVLQKSNSIESAPSSEDASSSPLPDSTFPVYDSNYSATNRRRFTKMAGRTMKTVLSTFSPKISKKKYVVPESSQEPLWPNSMNTFARGITTSKEQQTMSLPQEQSLASIRIQLDWEERELLRLAAANAAIFTRDLLRFDPHSPLNSLSDGGVLMSSYSDSALYGPPCSYSDSALYCPPCQKCTTLINLGPNTEHYQCEATSWRTTSAEGTPSNFMHIEGNHLVLTEGPPEDEFFA